MYEGWNNDACEAGDSQEHASFQMIIATRKSNERFSSDGWNGNIYIMRKTTEYRKRIK